MQDFYNYKQYKVLYVDDEELSLKYFARNLAPVFDVLTAPSAAEGLRLLEEHGSQIGLIVTDQRMPQASGVEFLEKARQTHPRILRILATAYSDMDATVQAVNTGAIYKYIAKPFDFIALELLLKRAMEFFILQQERDMLLREKMGAIHRMMMTDRLLGLGVMASGLGHHLRNSLVAIKAFLDLAPAKLAEERLDLGDLRDPNYWNGFYAQAQQQLQKVVEFLRAIDGCVAQPQVQLADAIQPAELLASARDRHAASLAGRGIQVEIEKRGTVPVIQGNAAMLQETFASLIREQASTLPEKGHIRVLLAAEAPAGGGPGRLLVEMSDTGPGFPEDALYKIFDPFYIKSNAPSDFAIGLLSCFFMVYHHGGTLEALPANPAGLRFRIHLPVDAKAVADPLQDQAFLRRVFEIESLWEHMLIRP